MTIFNLCCGNVDCGIDETRRKQKNSAAMSGKKLRSNKTQLRMLVDYMSTNEHMATGEFTGPLGPRRAEAHWLKLKLMLSNYGPDRTVDQWKQTWKDLKKNARHENALNALANDVTGNATDIPIVSEITKKILDTIGHESSSGIGPAESAIGAISGEFMQELILPPPSQSIPISLPPFILPTSSQSTETPINLPHSSGHILENEENIPPPSTSHTPQQPPRLNRPARPHDAFAQLQQENNDILQSIVSLLGERNKLLSEQNKLLAEANSIAKKNSYSQRERD